MAQRSPFASIASLSSRVFRRSPAAPGGAAPAASGEPVARPAAVEASAPLGTPHVRQKSAFGAIASRSTRNDGDDARRPAPAQPVKPVQEAVDEVVGVVESVKRFNDWGFANIWAEGDKPLKVQGQQVVGLTVGAEYRFRGRMVVHEKYGPGLDLTSFEPHIRLDERAITKYMVSTFKGVGEATARKHLEAVMSEGGLAGMEALRQKLLKMPWEVVKDIEQSTKRKAQMSADDVHASMVMYVERDLATRFAGNINSPVLKSLAAHLLEVVQKERGIGKPLVDPISLCWAKLVQDPYAPIAHVSGYGFASADFIGKSVHIPANADVRLAALVAHCVELVCQEQGHTFVDAKQALAAIGEMDRNVDARVALAKATQDGTVVVDADCVYPRNLHRYESDVARLVAQLCRRATPMSGLSQEALVTKARAVAKQVRDTFVLDDGQAHAIAGILSSNKRLHLVTAGPGAGKTALMEVLVEMMPKLTARALAPTGQVSKVLGARVGPRGVECSTIHSALKGSCAETFQVNAQHPLECDLLIVDEFSFACLGLARGIFDAVPENAHVVLLADEMQLQSIDPGRVLADLIGCGLVDHHVLTKTHRNAGGILQVGYECRAGELSAVDRDNVLFSHTLGDACDEFAKVQADYMKAVARHGSEKVCLLMSRKKGNADEPGWNTTYANAKLRQACNPFGKRIVGTLFYVNDRVVIRESVELTQKDGEAVKVVNGDRGTIVAAEMSSDGRDAGARWLRLELDDGRCVDMEGQAMGILNHAYAVTIHVSQGSEYEEVIAVMTPGRPSFINQTTLITGFSRAKQKLLVYGNDDELRRIARTPAPVRNSRLMERIRAEAGVDEDRAHDAAPRPRA